MTPVNFSCLLPSEWNFSARLLLNPHVVQSYKHPGLVVYFRTTTSRALIPPHSTRRDRTLICQGGTKGDLRQWNYTASEVSPPPQQRDFGDGGAGAGLATPRNENAPPVAVVRKLTHQVMVSGGGQGTIAS